jgi:hypothetical protein
LEEMKADNIGRPSKLAAFIHGERIPISEGRTKYQLGDLVVVPA